MDLYSIIPGPDIDNSTATPLYMDSGHAMLMESRHIHKFWTYMDSGHVFLGILSQTLTLVSFPGFSISFLVAWERGERS